VQNGPVLLLIGIGLAIFVVPPPWNIPIVILFGLLEIAETSWAWRWAHRAEDTRGPKTLVGATGRAVTDCRPSGTVRVHAVMWQAECEAGVDGGKRIRVIAQDEQTLIVEPIETAA
jgi:membrane-bound ClpP family serine protease